MQLVLDHLPFTQALRVLRWCHGRGIDADRASQYMSRVQGQSGGDMAPWVLDIPDHYITWLTLEFGSLEPQLGKLDFDTYQHIQGIARGHNR
jgi:hypothetical protein